MISAGTRADQQLDATVTVTINDVLDIDVTDNLTDITVNQDPELEEQVSQMELGSVDIKVYAISNWKLGLCYEVGGTNKLADYPFEDNPIYEHPAGLPEDKNYLADCATGGGSGPVETWNVPTDPPVTKMVKVVKDDGTNNTDAPFYGTYYFGIHLDNLGDRGAGEVFTFTIHFTVLDPTDP
jgi:hypothetical protein